MAASKDDAPRDGEGMLLNSDYDWEPASKLDGKIVGYYFAASWDKRCKIVTPIIAEVYKKIVARGEKFGMVYVGFDRDEKSFRNFIATMPWLSMPCGHSGVQALASQFDVRDLPTLLILDEDSEIITRDGARLMVQDREGSDFPWRPRPVFDVLAPVEAVHGAAGEVEPAFGSHDYTGLFFGAAWAEPVQQFTPKLRTAFEAVVEAGKSFQVFYVPSDKDEEQYNEFVKAQPWLALPFKTPLKPTLSRMYNVERIPRLVIVDNKGKLVCEDACTSVMHDPTGSGFPWATRAAYTFSDTAIARQFPGLPTVMLLLDGVPDGADKTAVIAAFERVAEATKKALEGNRHQTAPLFLYGDESHLLTRKARAFAGFGRVPPPNLLVTDGAHNKRFLWGPKGGRMGRVFPKETQIQEFVRAYMGSHLSASALPAASAAAVAKELEPVASATSSGAGTGGAGAGAGAGAGSGGESARHRTPGKSAGAASGAAHEGGAAGTDTPPETGASATGAKKRV